MFQRKQRGAVERRPAPVLGLFLVKKLVEDFKRAGVGWRTACQGTTPRGPSSW